MLSTRLKRCIYVCNIKMSIEIHVTQVLNKSMLLISLIISIITFSVGRRK